MCSWTYAEEGESGPHSLPVSQTPEVQRAGGPSLCSSSASMLHQHVRAQPSLQGWAPQIPFRKIYAGLIIGMYQERARYRVSPFLALLYLPYLMFHNWIHAIWTSCSCKYYRFTLDVEAVKSETLRPLVQFSEYVWQGRNKELVYWH